MNSSTNDAICDLMSAHGNAITLIGTIRREDVVVIMQGAEAASRAKMFMRTHGTTAQVSYYENLDSKLSSLAMRIERIVDLCERSKP